jgi:CheY-like chemotaxis protein
MGMRVASAKDGIEGLAKLTDSTVWDEDDPPFLFALVDMAMPGMDGCEMARRAGAHRMRASRPPSCCA